MEMESSSYQKQSLFARVWSSIKASPKKIKSEVVEFFQMIKRFGQDDPRRVIHSIKVGLCLSLVSLLYYFQPVYDNFGVTAMWAVMTVVVVFEFSVGATFGKGLNRALATLVAGALGVGANHLASLSGQIGEPILLAIFVFLQAAASTFLRFFPKIKARYDYGMLIFILTFSLISVSGFRDDEIIGTAQKRLSTVFIGGLACVIISILVCPVWAGEDLHNLIALNMEKLGNFLEGFGDEYFGRGEEEEGCKEDRSFIEGYKSVLNSKSSEETLANFARWEPGHGRFKFRHPWKYYLKIGSLTRQCACRIEALNGYLEADIQGKPEIRSKIRVTCTELCLESGKALKELALAVKNMTKPLSADSHIENSKSASKNLNTMLKSGLWEDADLLDLIPVATVASLLIDIVNCTEEIAGSVQKLASMAGFASVEPTVSPEKPQTGQPETSKTQDKVDSPHVVVTVREPTQENENSLESRNGMVRQMES
ncbi:hypothetical protein SLE2022_003710 [Rubroshorea leprosula]